MFNYRDAEGTQESKPLAMEVNGNTVYIRKSIQRKTRTTESGTLSYWSYKEAVLTKEEYLENQVAITCMLEMDKSVEERVADLDEITNELLYETTMLEIYYPIVEESEV